MLNWNSIHHDRQRRQTLRREADAARLAARLERAPRYHPLRPVAAWTGRRLVRLGFSLLCHAREWDYRSNTGYNGAKSSAQVP